MSDDKELNARLRDFEKVTVGDAREAADRIEQLVATNEALTAKVKLMDDLDAINGEKIEALEAKLAKAVEALEALIHLAHDCEKELTEDLHHMDFCGESEPLTKARATLAEITSGVATTPYGLEGEIHE